MAIPAGTRLGVYEVVAQIGAGGMGEVYSAHDTRLNRDVALKVLPEAFARDTQRMARFEREAKMLASLNHPNIAAIYGLEESGPIRALVMELVEGPTLAERIASGPVALDEALPIARQVADAVEYAHEKSVIHRDLKPANIKVKADGTVKVLDFGLAKALSDDPTEGNMSNSPTLSMAATMQGVILGTAAYMSPEQAKGKQVDRRADVWAFGVVLYEMLTGQQLYKGETVSETMAQVMMKEPSFDTLPANTPPAIRNLLRRCLDKDPRQRLRDVGEARVVIQGALSGAARGESAAAGSTRTRALSGPALLVSTGTLLLGAMIAGVAIWNLKPLPTPLARPVTRTVIDLPPGDRLAGLDQPTVAISSDGSQLAYVAARSNVQQLFLRPMDSPEVRPIAGTEGATNPFFSPDGQWLGFYAGGRLKKILVSGGTALTLTAGAGGPRGASWGSQGMIAFAPLTSGPLQQVLDAGGASQALTRLEKGEVIHRWPEFLPGGKAVLFAAGANAASFQVAVSSITTGERRTLIPSGTHPRYAPSGHLIYEQQGTLMAVPFDAERLAVRGTPVPVVEGVVQSVANGDAQYALSATGSLVYVSGSYQATQRRLVWVDRKGMERLLTVQPRTYRNPRISPDGMRVAVTIDESESHIWIYDLARDALSRFTFQGSTNLMGAWSPDGKRIAFGATKDGPQNLFSQAADGSGGMERLATSDYTQTPNSWSRDGQLLAFVQTSPAGGRDISALRLGSPSASSGQAPSTSSGQGSKPQPFLQTPADEGSPSFSPDGHWLVYMSDESGRSEIYVQPYPGPGGKAQISTDGGTEPAWNPNGKELFYRSGDKMMAVDVTTQPAFSAGKPRMLFEAQYERTTATLRNYDVSPDGQRFLMIKAGEQSQASTQINVVVNWFEELKRRVPTGTK